MMYTITNIKESTTRVKSGALEFKKKTGVFSLVQAAAEAVVDEGVLEDLLKGLEHVHLLDLDLLGRGGDFYGGFLCISHVDNL